MNLTLYLLVCLTLPVCELRAQTGQAASSDPESAATQPTERLEDLTEFDRAAIAIQQQLSDSVETLNALREQVTAETIPLSRRLNALEDELKQARQEYQQKTRLLDSRTLDLSNLRTEISSREETAAYLSNLLDQYIREFETRLHIAEMQRYRTVLEEATLAPENRTLSDSEIFAAQAKLLETSLSRLEEALGGTQFSGTAVDPDGKVLTGTFILMGPSCLFKSRNDAMVGSIEQRLGSLEPAIIPYGSPADAEAAANLAIKSSGSFPLDPTLGNAHKIEEIEETFVDEVKKGGVVMWPIFIMAGAALLVALGKLVYLLSLKKPTAGQIRGLTSAIADRDEQQAKAHAATLPGPAGEMLRIGVEHLSEPRELIEEVMYEKVLSTRLKLQSFLPFVAVSAASAPLLGLLGTVTGIINTFALITIYGSGDVKTLSGGISEALITTKYGLIVAIPSLLIHAFLSRKARGVQDDMEKAAVALINQVSKTPQVEGQAAGNAGAAGISVEQLQELIQSISSQQARPSGATGYSPDSAGRLMRAAVIVYRTATVGEAIATVRSAQVEDDGDIVIVVDSQGTYLGLVEERHLLKRPEQTPIESLIKKGAPHLSVDTHRTEIERLFNVSPIGGLPVLDHRGHCVGLVTRGGISQ